MQRYNFYPKVKAKKTVFYPKVKANAAAMGKILLNMEMAYY